MSARTRVLARASALVGAVLAVCLVVPVGSAQAASGQDCGQTIYKSDGTPWKCTFADDFNGSSLDRTKWVPQLTSTSGYNQGTGCFVDSPRTISQSGGQLQLSTIRENLPFYCASGSSYFGTWYNSGMVTSFTKFAQAYGRFEFRATFPDVGTPGLQSSLWLWPENYFTYGALSGEIDVAEWYSSYSDRVIPYLHYTPLLGDPNMTNNYCMVTRGQPHTYRLDWTPTSITISYDDKVCLRNTNWLPLGLLSPAPFNVPFFLALTQMPGAGDNAPTWATPQVGTMKVDYVRVWS